MTHAQKTPAKACVCPEIIVVRYGEDFPHEAFSNIVSAEVARQIAQVNRQSRRQLR